MSSYSSAEIWVGVNFEEEKILEKFYIGSNGGEG